MENRIEQEIGRTLDCLGDDVTVRVGPEFAERLSGRIAAMRTSRSAGYRSRIFYPAVIMVLVVLNGAMVWVRLRNPEPDRTVPGDQVSVLAGEYGMGPNGYNVF